MSSLGHISPGALGASNPVCRLVGSLEDAIVSDTLYRVGATILRGSLPLHREGVCVWIDIDQLAGNGSVRKSDRIKAKKQ